DASPSTRRDIAYSAQLHRASARVSKSPELGGSAPFPTLPGADPVRPPSINSAVAALRFFFTVTLDRPDLARRLTVVREPRRLPAVLSVEEVRLLLQAASGPKYKAALPPTAPGCASPRWSRSRLGDPRRPCRALRG